MTVEENRRRYEQAREKGRQDRRIGKRIGDSPYRGDTKLVRDLAAEWQAGWREADSEIKARRA